jgi:NAD(P)-dependent dehydrogenase (short-subunit alcohol dehydrogenase family)
VRRRDLTGQVVVVTGAAGGIGAALSRSLALRGARLALLGLGTDDLESVRSQVPGSATWAVDVTDGAALQRVAAEVVERFGRVDVLVVNAGIGAGGSLLATDAPSYDKVIEVNLLGSVRTVRAFLPALVDSRGYVLQIASLAALVHAPLMSAYCASKAGVEAMAHSLRAELAHRGVRVGVAYLAFTDTAMVHAADSEPAMAAFRASLPGPFGRTHPLPPAVSRLVAGIERRSAKVYAQGWLRAIPPVHAWAPSVITRTQARRSGETEAALARPPV